jgi:hypothetical protein
MPNGSFNKSIGLSLPRYPQIYHYSTQNIPSMTTAPPQGYGTSYGEEAERMEFQEYTRTDNLLDAVGKLRNIAFSLQSQRTQGLQIISNLLRIRNLFSPMDRFPAGAYICLTCDDWPDKIEQCVSSLNYKVPDVSNTDKDLATGAQNYQSSYTSNNKTQKSGSNSEDDATKCIKSLDERGKFEKALKSFTTSLADMERQLRSSLLTTRIFERKLGLVWR